MPLSLDNIIQSKTGSFESTSGTVSLDASTTAGSAVIVCAAVGGTGFGADTDFRLTEPTGGAGSFVDATGAHFGPGRATPYIFVKKNVAAGESSWTLPVTGGSQLVAWYALELTGVGLDPNDEFFINSGSVSIDSSVASTRSTGTTADGSSFDTISIAIFAGAEASSTIPAWSGYTNGFEELAEVGVNNASRSLDIAVAYKFALSLGTTQCTASVSPDAYSEATLVTFYADGSKRAPDLTVTTGFEFGTATGMATGSAVNLSPGPVDEIVGSPEIVTAHARSGTYCLKLSSTSALESVAWTNAAGKSLQIVGAGSAYPWVDRFHVYFETSLPSADTEIAWVEAGSLANGVTFWYRSASSKIGVKVGTGTEVLSDATVAADKWIGIDYRYDARATTHLCDWQVDYDSLDTSAAPMEQTQASGSGMTVATISRVATGWPSARTVTMFVDDHSGSKIWGTYPLGDIRHRVIKVDPAGTPTVSGTSGNFKVMTSNGTMGTFSASGARDAVDDVPPVVGASADGIAQVTAASGDYVEFPMETWTAAPTNVPRALRVELPGWADSGNPATIGFQTYDGTTVWNPSSQGDHGFDNATLAWLCRMVRPTNGFYLLTQAKLDAFTIRVGYSTDATPDVGFHSIFAELAYQPADVFRVSDAEGGTFTLDVRQDPFGAAVASLLITSNHASRGCTANTTVNGVDYTHHVNALETYEWSIGASSITEVTAYGLTPDSA